MATCVPEFEINKEYLALEKKKKKLNLAHSGQILMDDFPHNSLCHLVKQMLSTRSPKLPLQTSIDVIAMGFCLITGFL